MNETFNYNFNEAYIQELYDQSISTRLMGKYFFLSCSTFIILVAFASLMNNWSIKSFFVYSIALIMLFIINKLYRLKYIRNQKTSTSFNKPISVFMNEEELKITTDNSNSKCSWKAFYKIKETKLGFLLYPSKSIHLYFQKNLLSQESIVFLKALSV